MKKIFFISWNNPKFYNLIIFLSRKLSLENYQIKIYAKKHERRNDIIEKLYFGKNCKVIYCPIENDLFPNFLNLLFFSIYCLFKYISIRPENIIFFNQKALIPFLFIRAFKNNCNLIYHNFDFELPIKLKSYKERFLANFELFITKYADFLVFPSKERANLFQKKSKINKKKFFIMQNSFPIKFFSEKSNKLDAFLKKKLLKNNKIICNIGSIGPSHYLSEVIESFQYLNKKYILIIAGSSINNYHLTLLNKINKLNLNNQVFIFKNIKNKFWFEVLFKSKIGLCFYKQDCTSHKFMAGTSTKFNNYLMANVPMLVNFNKDFLRFKKKFDIFDTVDPKNPKKIAKKINSLINNKNRYHQIKVKQKKSFNSHLNFDYQFKKSYKIVLK